MGEGGGECAKRHNPCVNLPKKTGAISARVRSAAKTTEYIGVEMKQGECTVSALSAGPYTATLYVMVNRLKGGGHAPMPSPA
jgi:hypothetical protein